MLHIFKNASNYTLNGHILLYVNDILIKFIF